MHWITIILIGIAANLDNLGIGLAYGIKKTRIPLLSNVTIAFISMAVTYISVKIGSAIAHYLSPHLADMIGSFLLAGIGIYMIVDDLMKTKKDFNLDKIDKDQNNIISFKEAALLGLILSINCLATGIAIGANGISAIWTVLSIGFFSVVAFSIGGEFGLRISKTVIGRKATILSGVLLIFIGIFELFI